MLSAVLSYVVPLALVIAVVERIGRSRANLLLVPVVYEFGRAAYIDTFDRLFAGMGSDQIGVLLLLACALSLVALRPAGTSRPALSVGLALVGGYGVWVVVSAVLSFAEGMAFGKAVYAGLYGLTLPAAVAGWLLALSRVTEYELIGVVRVVVGMTAALCLLYTMQAVGIRSYPYTPYMQTVVDGRLVIRDFLTFPLFAVPLSLAWAASAGGRAVPRLSAAVVCLTAIAATFTRSLVLAGVAALCVASIAGRRRRVSRDGGGFPVSMLAVALALAIGASLALDTFWGQRLNAISADASVTARLAAIVGSVQTSSWVDAIVGHGYAGRLPSFAGVVVGDGLWIALVYRLGLAGVVLLLGAILGACVDAVRASRGFELPSGRTLGAIAAALPLALIPITLAGVPSGVNLGFGLALGPALVLGLVRTQPIPEQSHHGAHSLPPLNHPSPGWRAVLLTVGIAVMVLLEIAVGAFLAR